MQDAKKHALYYRLAAAGLVDNEYAAALKENAAITATARNARPGPKGALTGSSAWRRVLRLARPLGHCESRPQRPEHYKQAKRRAAMRQAVRPPQAVPRTRPAPYKRYVKYALAAASGFMALFLICRCVSLREGPVGVHDLATGASSYENTQSKELSKTELKETDDEIACCP